MLVSLIEEIKAKFIEHVESRYHYSLSQLIVEQPPKVELGDLAFPFCFELAKYLKRPPRQVATEVASSVGTFPGVAKIQVAGPGYIIVFLTRGDFFKKLFQTSNQRPVSATSTDQTKKKIILEHTK